MKQPHLRRTALNTVRTEDFSFLGNGNQAYCY